MNLSEVTADYQSLPSHSNDIECDQLHVQSPPLSTCELCVIVPVQNEAETLYKTLDALANQVDLQGNPFHPCRYEIILFANNCSDSSAAIAYHFAATHPELALHVVERNLAPKDAYIGRVRQLLMHEAYRRFARLEKKRGVIASTDGDSMVDSTWIAATLREVEQGADAIGGRILISKEERSALDPYARACYLREVGYQYLLGKLEAILDPDPFDRLPRHHQHYGASLAVTAEMYAQAGGMPAVRTPEDVAFYRALLRVGARFHHSPHVRVTTSARQIGRATNGLANQLNQWVMMGKQQQPFLVEDVSAVETRLKIRYALRKLRSRIVHAEYQLTALDTEMLSSKLGVENSWLTYELKNPQPFNLFLERIEQRQREEGQWKPQRFSVKIEQALSDLRLRLYTLQKTS